MFFWEILLLGDEVFTIRKKHNIETFEEAINEVVDLVEIIRLEFHKLGIDNEISFVAGESLKEE